jgi:hypothetical protein
MQVIKIDKNIYEFKNFLNNHEVKTIREHLAGLKEYDWIESKDNWNRRRTPAPEYPLDQINNRINSIFMSGHIDYFEMISRYLTGDRLSSHRDEEGYHKINWGCVIYLNSDYVGGEIYYPDLDIVHKPDPGSMVVHAGNIEHGVYKVEEGIKYMMSTFIHDGYIDPNIVN